MFRSGNDVGARWLRSRGQPWRFLLITAALMTASYGLLYFPYPPGSAPLRLLARYLATLARVVAWAVRLFDPSALVWGDEVRGRFALKIVLDCAALDAHALLACAMLAFPAPWRRRAVGLAVGALLLASFNVARIVSLYLIGSRWPEAFHVAHEEIFQLGIILVALASFWAWTLWSGRQATS